ncbi:septum formation family protein [Kribbella sp. NBC_00482]|uniref:septum formation family protein n=1 Tax=Kribbella sp. NBC_00482 TaxID=2975968 RepID=UPI002E188B2F
MADPIVDELRRLAGPELYRRNAFRISGLLADANARTARQVAQRLRAALEVGADIDLGTATSRDPHEIQAACDLILGDPRRRLVHEVFAPWGDDVSRCGCESLVHRMHDSAVAAHSATIGLEQDGGRPDDEWKAVWQIWSLFLAGAPAHLESRVRELDDPQLDRAAVAAIEAELPRTLVQPLVDLAVTGPLDRAGTLVDIAGRFPNAERLHRRLVEAAAAPLYEDLEERRTQVARRIGEEPVDPIVAEIERDLLPQLQRLDALLPSKDNHRTSALHDQLAILLNNCAVDLMNRGKAADGRAERWLDRAGKLVIDQRDRDLIDENRQAMLEKQRAMREFREQVDYLFRMRGKYAAQRLLRQARAQTSSPSVRAEIDQMLAEISAGTFNALYSPSPQAKTRPVPPKPRRRRRLLAWLLVLALIAVGVWHWWPQKISISNDKISDNAPAGTCLDAQSNGWQTSPTDLRGADCDSLHWAEILGYVQITKVPAAYPGDVQANALGQFLCGEALVQQRLNESEYDVTAIHAPAQRWNNGKNASKYENYAACVVQRHDRLDIGNDRVTRPDEPKAPKPVAMDLDATKVADNAPVGTCVRDRVNGQVTDGALTDKVKIVRCSEWHWGQIFGYPTLYQAGQSFPGDSEVDAASRSACASKIPSLRGFATWVGPPSYPSWEDLKQAKYAVCLVHRADNKPFKGAAK